MRPSKLEPGQQYGHIVLIRQLREKNKHGSFFWLCSCVCGKEKKVPSSKVRQGCSCGCIQKQCLIDTSLVGLRFGRLLVKERLDEVDKFGCRNYVCECNCGTVKILSSHNLRKKGGSLSCGCLAKELGLAKLPHGQASYNHLYSTYRLRAEKKNCEFTLSDNHFKQLVKSNCHYCNISPKQLIGGKYCNGKFVYNGIDRIDSTKGYTKENCVACCGVCNKMKLDADLQSFLDQIEMIYKHRVVGG